MPAHTREIIRIILFLLVGARLALAQSICYGFQFGIGNVIDIGGGFSHWNVYDNTCRVVDGLTTNENACSSQHGIFACSPEPIIFSGYTNMQTGVRYLCSRDTATESCGENVISVCCAPFITRWTIQTPIIVIAIVFLLYGVYTILFGVCILVLTKAKIKRPWYRFHCLSVTALFILATASVAINTVDVVISGFGSVGLTVTSSYDLRKLSIARLALLFLGNMITDIVMVWRCYIVWGGRIRVIILPVILCLANNVIAIVNLIQYLSNLSISAIWDFPFGERNSNLFLIFVVITVITNVLLTGMIAGRLFYQSRQATLSLPHDSNPNRLYRTVIPITLESGMLYPIALLLYGSGILMHDLLPDITAAIRSSMESTSYNGMHLFMKVMQYNVNQFAGIAPTVITVRLGLGKTMSAYNETKDHTVETFHAASRGLNSEVEHRL
ncbi:hypothetical protein Moror_11652 [Moniliophthora roreri MCA 2997]|uniref:Uncharacterized protein n=1 Tax=Moniliophthora roreri (strain MCA 2997) TaxID=1381753 RepID=V2X0T6_MONRO|nr:hypothetical protein Moror_11652 [Moniliophthora roreri MCA 2997]